MGASPTIRIEEKLKLLQRENDLLNSVIESATDSIYAKDLEGRYIAINQRGAEYLGRTVEDVIGKTDTELFGEDAQLFLKKDAELFQGGDSVVYENSLTIGDEVKYFWTNKSVLKDTNGETIGLIGISRDVTDSKNAQNKYQFFFENAPIALWEEDFSEVKTYIDTLKSNGVEDLKAYLTNTPNALDKCMGLIRIMNVNNQTVVMNGAKDKLSLIQGLRNNLTPESQSVFIDEIVALSEGETTFQTDFSFVNEIGDVVDVIFNLSVLPGHEENLSLVLASAVDVTDMRKLTNELSNIKLRYQSIVEAQTEMICRLNPKGEVMFQNAAFSKFFSFKISKKQKGFITLFPPDSVELCQKRIAALTTLKPTTIVELSNYDSQGNLVWQEWSITAFYGKSGLLLGYQAVGADVTDRKNAQEALATSEARWRSIFTHADDLIATVNTSGYILSINDYAGLPEGAKWAGKKIEEVLSPENAIAVLKLLNSVIVAGKPIKTELEIKSAEGEKLTFGVALSPISYGKRIISVVCIARDITETKRLEKQTKEALIEGQENERMRVSQELHDGLGQLFTAIKLNIQQIQNNPSSLDASLKEQISTLETRIDQAITEVKNISRNLMPDVLWHFGLKPAVEDFIEKLNSSTDVNISLELVDMDIRTDSESEQALFRVCQELVNNSLRHANCENVYVQLINHSNSIMLMVEDDGKGFSPTSISEGFGLQNIKSRIEIINGVVEIDSNLGTGTVTTIEVPLTDKRND